MDTNKYDAKVRRVSEILAGVDLMRIANFPTEALIAATIAVASLSDEADPRELARIGQAMAKAPREHVVNSYLQTLLIMAGVAIADLPTWLELRELPDHVGVGIVYGNGDIASASRAASRALDATAGKFESVPMGPSTLFPTKES